MSKKEHFGQCHICGNEGKLSFEHVPPKAAFNDKPVVLAKIEELIGKEHEPITKGKIQQKGSGDYTLCERCNNNTGAWYGSEFVNWCHQSLDLIIRSEGKLSLQYPYYIYPLRVIKQIVCMFLSTNNSRFREAHPYLEKFVLNPEVKYLPPNIRIYTFAMTGRISRHSGVSSMLKHSPNRNKIIVFSEIAFPPLGYVMAINSDPPDTRLFEITHFAKYGYNEWDNIFLRLPILPVIFYFPGDYRTEEQINRDRIQNEIDAKILGV